MIINNKEVKEIVVTSKDGELIASITDDDMIVKKGYVVKLCK